jgi:hypothetical protein
MEVFTGQKPEWKHYDGYVMGMICWGYLFRTQTPQLGAKARHDRWGIISTAWSHLLYDPYTSQLVKFAYVSGNPNVLYKDVMGAQCQLGLEILRAARNCSEGDHRNIMAAVDRPQTLRKEQSFAARDAMREGGPGSVAAEKAMMLGRALDESAMEMLSRLAGGEFEGGLCGR